MVENIRCIQYAVYNRELYIYNDGFSAYSLFFVVEDILFSMKCDRVHRYLYQFIVYICA